MDQQINTHYYSDEITFLELVQIFWQQKWLILFLTLFCCGISITYLYLNKPTKPVYEAKAIIVAPKIGDLSILNVAPMVETFDVREVYKIFSNALESQAIKQLFFKQFYLPSITEKQKQSITEEALFNSFLTKILIMKDVKSPLNKFTITVKTDNPDQSREWLKQYIALAKKKAEVELAQLISSQSLALAKKINLLKEVEENNRKDSLAQLKDGLAAAKAAGMQNASISFIGAPASNLRMLESTYNFYNKINLSDDAVKLFRLDGLIYASEMPIKSRDKLILILGLLTGLIMGIATALLRHALIIKK